MADFDGWIREQLGTNDHGHDDLAGFAEAIGVGIGTLYKFKSGKARLSVETAKRMASALDGDVGEIMARQLEAYSEERPHRPDALTVAISTEKGRQRMRRRITALVVAEARSWR